MRALAAVTVAVALAGCGAMPQPAQQPPNGQTACIVRGLTGPIFSWPAVVGEPVLERLGYTVEVHDMGVAAAALDHCSVVVAHSWGAPPALGARGPRSVFIIDGFPLLPMHCQPEARCVSFHNITDVAGKVDGAEEIPASGAGAIPFAGHVAMPMQPAVWEQIVADLTYVQPMETTELPGGGGYSCQLQVTGGWITPGELKATDAVTGEVLIDIPAGTTQEETKCINAPDGHPLIVLHPAFGTQYEKARP